MRSATKRKTGKDKLYLAWLHTLPCICCLPNLWRSGIIWEWVASSHFRSPQLSPTEAAHVGDRGLSQKAPDRTAIPLCGEHHRVDPLSAHRLGKKFWAHYGIDRDLLIADLNAKYEQECAA